MPGRYISRAILGLFLVAALVGAIFAWRERSAAAVAAPGGAPELRFCTNPEATTPQLALWTAVQGDQADKTFRLRIQTWRQPTQLQTALLAGEGDFWLGHIDGIARARARGAPAVLLAVTGWRKMSVVSYDPAVSSPRSLVGRSLAYAPKGSPAVPLFRSLLGEDSGRVLLEPRDPKQLALLLAQRKVENALIPEPLVSVLLRKLPELRLSFSLEDAYGEHTGGAGRIPWAGLAVHKDVLRQYPDRVATLVAEMRAAATRLNGDLDRAADCLPEDFATAIPPQALRDSLERDLVLVESAGSVRAEIRAYLELAAPDIFAGNAAWFERGFLWDPPQ